MPQPLTFLKPKPPELPKRLMLPAIIEPSPNARGLSCMRISQFPKRPLSITLPWAQPPSIFIQQLNADYRQAFPGCRDPSSLDLNHWLYNRALDAEASVNLLEQQVLIADQEIVALKEQVRCLEIDVKVLGAGGQI